MKFKKSNVWRVASFIAATLGLTCAQNFAVVHFANWDIDDEAVEDGAGDGVMNGTLQSANGIVNLEAKFDVSRQWQAYQWAYSYSADVELPEIFSQYIEQNGGGSVSIDTAYSKTHAESYGTIAPFDTEFIFSGAALDESFRFIAVDFERPGNDFDEHNKNTIVAFDSGGSVIDMSQWTVSLYLDGGIPGYDVTVSSGEITVVPLARSLEDYMYEIAPDAATAGDIAKIVITTGPLNDDSQYVTLDDTINYYIGTGVVTTVPEPSSVLMIALGTVGGLSIRRRS